MVGCPVDSPSLCWPRRLDAAGRRPGRVAAALAEDVVDLLATLAEVEAAVAVTVEDRALLTQVGWPGCRGTTYRRSTLPSVLAAIAADGYEQAVVVAADAPDLPGMLIGKLLRPLTTPAGRGRAGHRRAGAARAGRAAARPGVAARRRPGRSHAPGSCAGWRRAAADVAGTPGWHRLRGPADLARLDPASRAGTRPAPAHALTLGHRFEPGGTSKLEITVNGILRRTRAGCSWRSSPKSRPWWRARLTGCESTKLTRARNSRGRRRS